MSSELVRASTDYSSWNPDALFGGADYEEDNHQTHYYDEQGQLLDWRAADAHGDVEGDWEGPIVPGQTQPELVPQEQLLQGYDTLHPSYSNPFVEHATYNADNSSEGHEMMLGTSSWEHPPDGEDLDLGSSVGFQAQEHEMWRKNHGDTVEPWEDSQPVVSPRDHVAINDPTFHLPEDRPQASGTAQSTIT